MATLVILRGVPASGKTTRALELVEAHGYVRVNRDEIRYQRYGRYWNVDEKAVTRDEHLLIRTALGEGWSVVVDATNLNPHFVSNLLNIAREFRVGVRFEDFPVSLDTALKNDFDRGLNGGRMVGGDVVEGFFRRYNIPVNGGELPAPPEAPREWLQVATDKTGLPNAYIVDTDGTVALPEHRSPYDTSRYDTDEPNWPVIEVVRSLSNNGHYILGVSGRSAEFRDVTESWWDRHHIPFDDFFMRRADDKRNDAEVKYDLFKNHIEGKYNVLAAIDDRPRVLRMWRAIGVPTLQVGSGREF
jgi:predicted kinase